MEALFKKAGDYIENRIEIVRLKTIDKSSEVLSTLLTQLIMIAALGMTTLMLSIGVAMLIGYWIGTMYWGFFRKANKNKLTSA